LDPDGHPATDSSLVPDRNPAGDTSKQAPCCLFTRWQRLFISAKELVHGLKSKVRLNCRRCRQTDGRMLLKQTTECEQPNSALLVEIPGRLDSHGADSGMLDGRTGLGDMLKDGNADQSHGETGPSTVSSPSVTNVARMHALPRLGPYVIERTLGYGTFSKVKLGRHLSNGHPKVALKMVSLSDLKENRELRKSLFIELQIIRNCCHVGMIRLYTVLLSKHHCTLVLEYPSDDLGHPPTVQRPMEGLPEAFRPPGSVIELYEWLEETSGNGLSDALVRSLFQQLVNVIDYLHSRGIVHRDIKPENIIVLNSSSRGLVLKLIDFGLATMIMPESSMQPSQDGAQPGDAPSPAATVIYSSSDLLEKGPWFGDYVHFETLITTCPTVQSSLARRLSTGTLDLSVKELFSTTPSGAIHALFVDGNEADRGAHHGSLSLMKPERSPKIQYCHSHDLSIQSDRDVLRTCEAGAPSLREEPLVGTAMDALSPHSPTSFCVSGQSTPHSASSTRSNGVLLKTRCGSEEYAPPELLLGKPYQGHLSDIWSMGVLLFVMYYGVLPFGTSLSDKESAHGAGSSATLYRQICSGLMKWPKEKHGKDHPGEKAFRELVRGMLRVIPDERWSLSQIRNSDWLSMDEKPS
jgi:serine/threonine protein kinase